MATVFYRGFYREIENLRLHDYSARDRERLPGKIRALLLFLLWLLRTVRFQHPYSRISYGTCFQPILSFATKMVPS